MKLYRALCICAAVAAALVLTAGASAATVGFQCITNNSVGDAAIGQTQLSADVTDPGGNQVDFTFHNSGPNACSITDVYFDDGALLGIAAIVNGAGVSFSQGATPAELPGANNAVPPFVTTAGFSADSDPPVQPNGVNPGEWLKVTFNLQPGKTFADVTQDLNSGDLRIGIHVQGYASGGSESFVNTSVIPLPAAAWSGLAMLSALGVAKGVRVWKHRQS